MAEMIEVFSAEVLAASGTATSDAVKTDGSVVYRFQYTTTGTGTTKIELLESLDGVTYVTNSTALGTTLAAGTALIDLAPKASSFIKLKITEDGGAAAATVTLMMLYV